MPPIIKLRLNDQLQLKKQHPCGGSVFRILRIGSDVRIVCTTCGRDMTMERVKLEKAIKKLLPATEENEEHSKGSPSQNG